MSRDWYYVRDGQQVGPVSMHDLKAMVGRGEIGTDDRVWCEGMADWQPAGAVEGLIPAARPVRAGAGAGRSGPPRTPRRTPAVPDEPPARPGRRPGSARERFSRPPSSGTAIAGFVCTLVGFLLIFVMLPLGALVGLIGLVLCFTGYSSAKRAGRVGFAIAGIVIGSLLAVLCILAFVGFAAFLVLV